MFLKNAFTDLKNALNKMLQIVLHDDQIQLLLIENDYQV